MALNDSVALFVFECSLFILHSTERRGQHLNLQNEQRLFKTIIMIQILIVAVINSAHCRQVTHVVTMHLHPSHTFLIFSGSET